MHLLQFVPSLQSIKAKIVCVRVVLDEWKESNSMQISLIKQWYICWVLAICLYQSFDSFHWQNGMFVHSIEFGLLMVLLLLFIVAAYIYYWISHTNTNTLMQGTPTHQTNLVSFVCVHIISALTSIRSRSHFRNVNLPNVWTFRTNSTDSIPKTQCGTNKQNKPNEPTKNNKKTPIQWINSLERVECWSVSRVDQSVGTLLLLLGCNKWNCVLELHTFQANTTDNQH